jgi:Arc/MetJ family transcription regulator
MRFTIDIDEKLLAEVMEFMGTRTKRETVRRAVEAAVASHKPWSSNLSRKIVDPQDDPAK